MALLSSQIAKNRLARYSKYQIKRKLISCCSLTINSTTIYFIQLRYSNTSLLYFTSFISQCVNKKQTHLHFTILIVLSFEKKDLRHNSIISNYSSLSYDNYLTIKLKFKEFNIFRNNNYLQNVNKNNQRQYNNNKEDSLITIKTLTLYQQIKILITKI